MDEETKQEIDHLHKLRVKNERRIGDLEEYVATLTAALDAIEGKEGVNYL
jgi:hypothetical protein